MSKPFKFRYVNEIVGSFVLIVLALLVVGIILAGRAQDWFEPVHRVGIAFPPEGSLGLQKGAEVQILGTTVGRVEGIRVRRDGRMRGAVSIKGDFIRFVRTDSRAIIRKKFGIAGDSYLEITQGKGEALPDDARLLCSKDTEIIEMAQDILKQVQDATVPAIDQIRLAVDEYTKLAVDLRDPELPLMKLLANLESITLGLKKGEGSAGQLLSDPAMAQEMQKILTQVNEALADIKLVLIDVRKTTVQLPAMTEKVGGELEDMPGLVLHTQETIREAERLIEGIQKHWVIKKYISQPQSGSLISPLEVSAP